MDDHDDTEGRGNLMCLAVHYTVQKNGDLRMVRVGVVLGRSSLLNT